MKSKIPQEPLTVARADALVLAYLQLHGEKDGFSIQKDMRQYGMNDYQTLTTINRLTGHRISRRAIKGVWLYSVTEAPTTTSCFEDRQPRMIGSD